MKKLRVLLALTMAISMLFMGCTPEQPEENDEKPISEYDGPELHFEFEDYPVIDGATALAPYYEAMTAELLGVPLEEANQYVFCNRTDGAYQKLVEREADMIFCSMPSEEQKQMAVANDFEFEKVPFLNGGFVFFVNKDNPVDSISIKEAHDIYAGKITNWKELGGDDCEIIAYQRPNNSGSQTGLYAYVIKEDELMKAPSEKIFGAMDGIVDAVANYDNSEGAIGYSYYYYVNSMHYQENVKLLAIDGVLPSDETIGNGTYPIINPSYVIISADTPKKSPIRDIIEWITSEKGKEVARRAGYVPREEK